jgi:hypothetical protein
MFLPTQYYLSALDGGLSYLNLLEPLAQWMVSAIKAE